MIDYRGVVVNIAGMSYEEYVEVHEMLAVLADGG